MDAQTQRLLITAGVGLTLVYIVSKVFNAVKNAGRPPLPPGPKGLPLVGNLYDLPQPGVFEGGHWLKHKEIYGKISSVKVMGQTMIILNDEEMAHELLDRRSAIYSSRPRQVFAGEIVGWENSLAPCPHNNRFRLLRKNLARVIGSKSLIAKFSRLQEAEVGHFLLHMLHHPEKLLDHIRREGGIALLKVVYGYTVEPHGEDPFVSLTTRTMNHFSLAAAPGVWMVDIFPFLKYIPEWFPGATFKKVGREWAGELHQIVEKPHAFTELQMAQGKPTRSFLATLLENENTPPEEQHTNKWGAMALCAAGSFTSRATMMWFFLAMTLYPDVQKKAQEELDRVIGKDRLPNGADRENLPYIEAVVQETLRWHSVVPLAVPHTCTKDDTIDGYFIPKGAMVIPNLWAYSHDEATYKDAYTFNPDRFLGKDPEPDPRRWAFGFGRRICPGQFLADNSLYFKIAQTLSVFSISKHVENGREVEPTFDYLPGLVSYPVPYKNTVKPRSAHHEKLIESIEEEFPWEESDIKIMNTIKV
ncbi:cytochrome P450 [Hypoxylon sp. FL1284]|nr:cytochrome P450 [Hypoxylon sp. FL1284]